MIYLFIDEFRGNSKFDMPRDDGLIFYLIKNLKDDFLEVHIQIFWPELLKGLSQMNEYKPIVSIDLRITH